MPHVPARSQQPSAKKPNRTASAPADLTPPLQLKEPPRVARPDPDLTMAATRSELRHVYESLTLGSAPVTMAAASGRYLNAALGDQRYSPEQVYFVYADGTVTLYED